MTAPAVTKVFEALTKNGAEVRFVGGCVRDAVARRPVRDVDLATPDPPAQVIVLLEQASLKAVPTGIDHGTVTAVADAQAFEVTTLRRDVETFGRHATVAFTDDWLADAERRDFTFNAMSCRPDGTLFDPYGGTEDLQSGRVRFVGDARARIEEDYLRLLRLFRFQAHFGKESIETGVLAIARELAPRLKDLSGERIRNEILRTLEAPDPAPIFHEMKRNGVLAVILREADGIDRLAALVSGDAKGTDPLLRLGALLIAGPTAIEAVASRLRLSNQQRDRLLQAEAASQRLHPDMTKAELRPLLYRCGRGPVSDALRLAEAEWRAAGNEFDTLTVLWPEVSAWDTPVFPLKGEDALSLGVAAGPEVGVLLRAVEGWWVDLDFAPDRTACLEELKRQLEELKRQKEGHGG